MTREVWAGAVLDVCVLVIRKGTRGSKAQAMEKCSKTMLPRKVQRGVAWLLVPEPDTGRPPENGKVLEITLVKELGKIAP